MNLLLHIFFMRIINNLTRACFFPNCTRDHTITYTYWKFYFPIARVYVQQIFYDKFLVFDSHDSYY